MDELERKKFQVIRIIAIALLIVLPLLYLGLTQILKLPPMDPTANQLMFQLFLILSLVQPVLVPFFENLNTKQLKKSKALHPMDGFMTVMITRCALVEAIFIYGFVVYLNTHNLDWMLYIYPIGIIATIVYFPREATYETFKQKLQAP